MKQRRASTAILLTLVIGSIAALPARGAEYFVNKRGADTHDGKTRGNAFLTIQKGLDALQPGDILTIGPGEYEESTRCDDLGGPDKETLIRAEIPGTVHLRGDVPAPRFRKVDGYRFVYVADFTSEVQAVNEIDTLTILQASTSVTELEFWPGACYHDADRGKLYISSSDLQPPDVHHYTVSVTKGFGLLLTKPKRVVVDGLSMSGFHSSKILQHYPGTHTVWGIMAAGARQCVIRNCTAFLNGGGIGMFSAYEGEGYNLIEKCQAYANYSKYTQEGGNICGFQSFNDEIRDCYAYLGQPNGIRIYGSGIRGPARMKNCLVWGTSYADIFLKGGQVQKYGMAENCITLGILHSHNVKNCLIGTINQYNRRPDKDTITYASKARSARSREFADPDNLDFRLQATSTFRNAAPDGTDRGPFPYEPNIFYVRPDGDDQADGLSMRNAWKALSRALANLRPGDTLYLEGGTYTADVELRVSSGEGKTTAIRGRGVGPVIIRGSLSVTRSAGLALERLNFAGAVRLSDSQAINFNNCRFSASTIRADSVADLRITHGEFTGFKEGAIQLRGCSDVFLSANVFDNPRAPAIGLDGPDAILYSDYNAYRSPDCVWQVKGSIVPLSELQKQHDRYSHVLTPELTIEDGLPRLRNRSRFTAGGPNGSWLGFYREHRDRPLRLDGPRVHSVTDTTANIEWWTSRQAKVAVAWGDTPECKNTTTLTAECFGSFSMTGLAPGRRYYFRIASADERHSSAFATPLTRGLRPEGPPLTFQTATKAVAPKTYYVATDRDDRDTGLSREQTWRTVSRAADGVRAGDTVLIAGGTYRETVRLRTTGAADRPVTFKAVPGERVVFDGDARKITVAFAIAAKQHLRFDGLYFRMFGNGGWESIFNVFDSQHIQITRCFMNGALGRGNSPQLLRAHTCTDVLMRNCVIASGFQGTYFTNTTNLRIENNVFLRNLICPILNSGGEPKGIVIKNNIFVDSIPSKVKVHLFELGGIDPYVFDNNCFYLRLPDAERKPFLFYGKGPGRLSIAEYEARVGTTNSILTYPRFQITVDRDPLDRKGNRIEFLADWLAAQKDLDFPLLFTTHPDLIKRGIGLQPEAFRDFHFSRHESAPPDAASERTRRQ